jgi:hypothetical protein
MTSEYMKKQPFQNHIKRINKLSSILSIIVGSTAAIVFFMLGKEFLEHHLLKCLTTLALIFMLIHLKANNLKQNAIIRYMTDAINDNEV